MRTNNCEKNRYTSKHAAREANQNNGKSLRVYYHRACDAYHVTKNMNMGGRQRRVHHYAEELDE